MNRGVVRRTAVVLISVVALVAPAAMASAAVPTDKPAVLAGWTQTAASSYAAWFAASRARAPWAAYEFDWSTDNCSASPDRPVGFDFRRACQRHDFGYRNYRVARALPANKARLDTAFLADMNRTCRTYPVAVRPACLAVARIYYQAVDVFGSLVAVQDTDLDDAARIKAVALSAA